jgi:hypothetical protein
MKPGGAAHGPPVFRFPGRDKGESKGGGVGGKRGASETVVDKAIMHAPNLTNRVDTPATASISNNSSNKQSLNSTTPGRATSFTAGQAKLFTLAPNPFEIKKKEPFGMYIRHFEFMHHTKGSTYEHINVLC